MDYGRSVLLMTAEADSGVAGGEPDVNPRGGIFGPHGWGGGIWDGTNALNGLEGLGWTAECTTPVGHPRAPRQLPVRGLGAYPEDCKQSPDFNACDNRVFALAQQYCYALRDSTGGTYAQYGNFDTCLQSVYKVELLDKCAQYCPAGTKSGQTRYSYTPGSACSATDTVKFVQEWLGVSSDGKWGPASQAALVASGQKYTDIANGCTGAVPSSGGGGYVAPPPGGKTPPGGTPPIVTHARHIAMGMNVIFIGVGLAALAGGAYLLSRKKRS